MNAILRDPLLRDLPVGSSSLSQFGENIKGTEDGLLIQIGRPDLVSSDGFPPTQRITVGAPCSDCPAIPPVIDSLQRLLRAIDARQVASPACAAVLPDGDPQ